MIEVPHFESEAEEADWWFTHQDLIADEFEMAQPKIGPSRLMRMRAAKEETARQAKEVTEKLSRSA